MFHIHPRCRIQMRLAITPKEVMRRLTTQTEYVVTKEDSCLQLTRKIRNRNSFLPLISAEVEPYESGAIATFVLKLHREIEIFMYCLLAVAAALTIVIIQGYLEGDPIKWPEMLLGLVPVPFALAFPHIGFWPEVSITRRSLKNLLT